MSERETHNIDDESEMTVEQCISKLINKLLKYLKQAGTDDKVVERYENEIVKIEGMSDIYYILSLMLENLVEILGDSQSNTNESDYMNLEKLVQKHEAEIRNHVRTEQQLRLYIEALENDEQGKKTQFHTLEDALKKSNQDYSNLKVENDRLKRELNDFKGGQSRRSKSKIIDSKKIFGDNKRSITNSQESIVNSTLQQRDFLKYLRKHNKPGSLTLQKGDLIKNLNDTSESAQITLRKAKKLLNSAKLPQNFTERRSDNTFMTKSIQKLISSHRRLRDGLTRSTLAGSSQTKLIANSNQNGNVVIPQKSRNKKSASKLKKKVPIFERKERLTANEIIRGQHKTKSHVPITKNVKKA